MLFVLLSKRFLHMTVLDGFAVVAIHANLLDRYKRFFSNAKASGKSLTGFIPRGCRMENDKNSFLMSSRSVPWYNVRAPLVDGSAGVGCRLSVPALGRLFYSCSM